MIGLVFDVFLYKGSEVDDRLANFLIDEVFTDKKLLLINVEKSQDSGNMFSFKRKIRKSNFREHIR